MAGIVATLLVAVPWIADRQLSSAAPRVAVQQAALYGYFFDPASWTRIFESRASTGYVVLSPAAGPGAQATPTYVDYAARVRAAGQRPLGFVYTDAARRDPADVVDQANRYFSFYGVHGIFLDSTTVDCAQVGYYASIANQIRAAHPGAVIVMNPRDNPGECYLSQNVADVVVNFEGSAADYAGWSPAAWVDNYPASRFWHVVYSTPGANLDATVELTKNRNAGHVYVTDDLASPYPFDDFPGIGYWSQFLTAARGAPYAPQPDVRQPIGGQRLGIPMFFDAPLAGWDKVLATPEIPHMVLNPNSGPGNARIANLAARRDQARTAGKRVYGYVGTRYKARSVDDVVADVRRYLDFYDVDGVFLDEVAPDCADAPYYEAITTRAKALKAGFTMVINPGVNISECFMPFTDKVVNFENTAALYRGWFPALWTYNYPPDRFWHLVHATSNAEISEMFDLAKRRNGGVVWATNDVMPNPWDQFPDDAYIGRMVSALGTSNPPPTTTTAPPTTAPPPTTAATTTVATTTTTTATTTTPPPTTVAGPPTITVAPPTAALTVMSPSQRIVDTRSGSAKLAAGSELSVRVTGSNGVPSSGVTAVVVNLTGVNATESTYLTAYPNGGALPNASNLNLASGETRANLALVKVGADGSIRIRNDAGSVDTIVDLIAWIGSTGPIIPVDTVRLADTRSGLNGVRGSGVAGRVGPNESVTIRAAGLAGIPSSGAASVLVNLTTTGPTASTYLTAFASGAALPLVSNLNVERNQTAANLVLVRLGVDGSFTVRNDSGASHVIADVQGWIPTGSAVSAVAGRALDTRNATGGVTGPVGRGQVTVRVSGVAGIPASGAASVFVNLTAVSPSGQTHLTAYPSGQALPPISNLNAGMWPVTANLALVRVGADGAIVLRNENGSVHLLADAQAWLP